MTRADTPVYGMYIYVDISFVSLSVSRVFHYPEKTFEILIRDEQDKY